jgi:hypothetical protein
MVAYPGCAPSRSRDVAQHVVRVLHYYIIDICHCTIMKKDHGMVNIPRGTNRLPSPTRINLSVRTCLQIRYSAENGIGPTGLVNYSLKS